MAPMVPIAVIDHMRYVVIDDEPCKANFLERANGVNNIHVALAQEALLKGWHTALDISKMDVENLSSLAEVANGLNDARPHLAETAHAKIQAVIRTWRNYFHCLLETLGVIK